MALSDLLLNNLLHFMDEGYDVLMFRNIKGLYVCDISKAKETNTTSNVCRFGCYVYGPDFEKTLAAAVTVMESR